MVKFVVSPEIQQLVSEYNTSKKLAETDEGYVPPESPSIEHIQLVHISSILQAHEPSKKSQNSLNNILKTTNLFIQPIEKPKPVPTYVCLADNRILSIKLEWRLCDTASSNKNTTP
jgi:hypothetical protein